MPLGSIHKNIGHPMPVEHIHYDLGHNPGSMANWGLHGFGLGRDGLKWARFAEWAHTGAHVGQPILKNY